MNVIKPPRPLTGIDEFLPILFLAGTIDMGDSVDWQADTATRLKQYPGTILNPRRDAWDKSWNQDINNPEFAYQVNWELDGLDMATLILINFEPDSKSPISLLELGLHANDRGLIVRCPKGYWRKGNVDIVCARHRVPVYEDLDQAVAEITVRLQAQQKSITSFYHQMAVDTGQA